MADDGQIELASFALLCTENHKEKEKIWMKSWRHVK